MNEKERLIKQHRDRLKKAEMAETLGGSEGWVWLRGLIEEWSVETQNLVMNPKDPQETDLLRGQFVAYKRVLQTIDKAAEGGADARAELDRLSAIRD